MKAIFLGEFLGTLFLILFGCGVVASTLLKKSKGEQGGWLAVTTGWFVAVVIAIFVAQSAGSVNADVNPCVSFAKYILGIYSGSQMLWCWLAQVLGAFSGATLVWLAYFPHWRETESTMHKLLVFVTEPAIRHYPSNFLCEVIGSVVLVVGVGAIFGSATSGHPAAGVGPYLVGVLVWGIGLSLGGPTGYAINPVRDFGPRLAHALLPIAGKGHSDWAYAWVPILGPLTGGLIGAFIWRFVFL